MTDKKAGLHAVRGRKGGRPRGLSKKAPLAESLYRERERSISEICEHLYISKPTLYRYLRADRSQLARLPKS
ncbi:MAG: helix-turn-helix domain-containing protein [Bacteroidota bacterium]